MSWRVRAKSICDKWKVNWLNTDYSVSRHIFSDNSDNSSKLHFRKVFHSPTLVAALFWNRQDLEQKMEINTEN